MSGTGGHIYPGISIAQLLDSHGHKIIFFGNTSLLTHNIIDNYGYNLVQVNISGWKNRSLLSFLKFCFFFLFAFLKSIFYILRYKINIIIGMGGYLEIPIVLAAKILGKKTIIHEQNFFPGLANKCLNLISDKTALGFDESRKYFHRKVRAVFTGNPIRKEFYNLQQIDKKTAKQNLNISKNLKVILIFGGSQGASFLNTTILDAIKFLDRRDELFFIHITGEKDLASVKKFYNENKLKSQVSSYYYDIFNLYFAADLVISRAGASTITELLVTKTPNILIPYPFATEDHQTKNAEFLKQFGFSEIYQEKNFDKDKFCDSVLKFLSPTFSIKNNVNFEKYRNLKFDENLYNLIKDLKK